ncbi:MAG: protein translocase subunit SecF [Gammaproteobacteria bacterium]|nr:protein translocase subunit SecF [Gammaproteobacteria bacterium]
MEFFKKTTHIDFLGQRKPAVVISCLLIAISIGSLAMNGLNFGVDFTGGTLVEIRYDEAVDPQRVRDTLAGTEFADAQIQAYGSVQDILIRLAPRADESSADLSNAVLETLLAAGHEVELRRVEFVGPQVGEELTEDGGLAMLYALIGILIYVGLRFETRLAVGSVAALLHDVILIIGFFSLTRMTFDLSVLAAILAVIGYSLNDTIVVFDRVRENFRWLRERPPVEVFNISLNQTLSRTIMTGVTTLLVLGALLIFGGETMQGFSVALILGVLVGTYSSIYVASAISMALGISKQDLMPVQKEGVEPDNRP